MRKISYIDSIDIIRTVEAKSDRSVMEGAIQSGIPGIDALCGGACSCATCHVYVDEKWLSKLPSASEMQASMLELAYFPRPNSRLSCQIRISDEVDGLGVKAPATQS